MPEAVAKMEIACTVNGAARRFRAWPMERLLDVLRRELKLTGTKEGCGEGECGACCVLLDGALVNSCLVPAAQAAGSEIRTIEGLARGEQLSAIQEAFVDCGGAQCGICTPGMVMAAAALIERHSLAENAPGEPQPDERQIRVGLSGNLCRCTGYARILEAVLRAQATGVRP